MEIINSIHWRLYTHTGSSVSGYCFNVAPTVKTKAISGHPTIHINFTYYIPSQHSKCDRDTNDLVTTSAYRLLCFPWPSQSWPAHAPHCESLPSINLSRTAFWLSLPSLDCASSEIDHSSDSEGLPSNEVGQWQAMRYHPTQASQVFSTQKVNIAYTCPTYSIAEKEYCRDCPLDSGLSATLSLSGVDVKINN